MMVKRNGTDTAPPASAARTMAQHNVAAPHVR